MSNAAARDWSSLEGETNQELQSEPWAREVDSTVLMSFLSDFRSASRERLVAEKSAGSQQAVVGASQQVVSRFKVGPADPEPWELDPYVGAETQVAADWWIAADGRWYAPELHPDTEVAVEPLHQPDEPVSERDLPLENVVVEPEVRTRGLRPYTVARRFA